MSFAAPANWEDDDEGGGYECERCAHPVEDAESSCDYCLDAPRCFSCDNWASRCECREDCGYRNLTTDEGQNVNVSGEWFDAYQDVRKALDDAKELVKAKPAKIKEEARCYSQTSAA